ncbi:MAG: hypothetical protein AAF599_03205 [Bacteroidota bacterium]
MVLTQNESAMIRALETGFWNARFQTLSQSLEQTNTVLYQPKAAFSVSHYQQKKWFVTFEQATFPDEILEEYLLQYFFNSVEVDDELSIIVEVQSLDGVEAQNYVAESLDHAVAYIQLFKEHEKLHAAITQLDQQLQTMKQSIGTFTEKCTHFSMGYL